MIITNEHFGKNGKNTLLINIAVMICITLDCVGLTQSSVIRIICHNVGLRCVFHLLNCLLLSLGFLTLIFHKVA